MLTGRLTVIFHQAKDLVDKDFGKCDPFCTASIGSEKLKTKTHSKGGKNPVWDQALLFNLKGVNANTEALHIQVFDEDLLSNDKLGRADIPLKALFEQAFEKKEGAWFQLVHFDNFKKIAGYIRLSIIWDGEHPTKLGLIAAIAVAAEVVSAVAAPAAAPVAEVPAAVIQPVIVQAPSSAPGAVPAYAQAQPQVYGQQQQVQQYGQVQQQAYQQQAYQQQAYQQQAGYQPQGQQQAGYQPQGQQAGYQPQYVQQQPQYVQQQSQGFGAPVYAQQQAQAGAFGQPQVQYQYAAAGGAAAGAMYYQQPQAGAFQAQPVYYQQQGGFAAQPVSQPAVVFQQPQVAPAVVYQQASYQPAAAAPVAGVAVVAAHHHHSAPASIHPLRQGVAFHLRTCAGGNLRSHESGEVDGKGATGPLATWYVDGTKGNQCRLKNEKGKWLTLRKDGFLTGKGKGGQNCYFTVVARSGHQLQLIGPHGGYVAIMTNGVPKNARNAGPHDPHTHLEFHLKK